MFKIGEFSKLVQVSVGTLRYYDQVGLLKPGQVDEFTGYRITLILFAGITLAISPKFNIQ